MMVQTNGWRHTKGSVMGVGHERRHKTVAGECEIMSRLIGGMHNPVDIWFLSSLQQLILHILSSSSGR